MKTSLEGQESSMVLAAMMAGLSIVTIFVITLLTVNYFYPTTPPFEETFDVMDLLTIELSNGNFTRKIILGSGLIDNFTKIDSRPAKDLNEAFFLTGYGNIKMLFQPPDDVKNFDLGDRVITTRDLLKIYTQVTDRNGNIISFDKPLVSEGTKGEVINVKYIEYSVSLIFNGNRFDYTSGWFYYVRFEITSCNYEKIYLNMWVGKDSLRLQG